MEEEKKPAKARRPKRRVTSPVQMRVEEFARNNNACQADIWERELVAKLFEAGQSDVSDITNKMAETELTCMGLPEESAEDIKVTVLADDVVTRPIASAPALNVETLKLPHKGIRIQDPGEKAARDALALKNSKYRNPEMDCVGPYVEAFVSNQLSDQNDNALYESLTRYERSCEQSVFGHKDLENTLRQNSELGNSIWLLEKSMVLETGECQDGNPVSASEMSTVAHFSPSAHIDLMNALEQVRTHDLPKQVLKSFDGEMARHQVLTILSETTQAVLEYNKFIEQHPPRLMQVEDGSSRRPWGRLCSNIGTLFHFLRRRECQNKRYQTDLRDWLTDLVALLLPYATWEDHLFILLHVMRCRPGVAPWLVALVQVPQVTLEDPSASLVGNAYLDHAIAVLGVILMPIKRRADFLPQLECDSWVVLDMDGDGSNDIDITEEDLISLLNQVPLKSIMEHMMKIIPQPNGTLRLFEMEHDELSLLQLFSCASYMVELFANGLVTYKHQRYKQFCKRLGCLIVDLVKQVTNLWQILKDRCLFASCVLREKLDCSYDLLVETAVCAVYSSQGLGVWQVLTSMPYHQVSTAQLWRLFYIMHQPYTTDLASVLPNTQDWDAEMKMWEGLLSGTLDDLVSIIPQDEAFYLLSAMSLLAVKGMKKDPLLARAAMLDILKIGWVSESNKENCSKACRTFLSSITSEHPCLISDILQFVGDKVDEVNGIYLFSDLPLHLWQPRQGDLAVLCGWLSERHLLTPEHNLARLILRRLNFRPNRQVVPRYMQCQLALGIVQAVMNFAPESNAVSIHLPKVANYVRNAKSEAVFTQWAWEMLAQLHLHLMDQDTTTTKETIYEPTKRAHTLPDIIDDVHCEVLWKGVRCRQSVACYVTLLMTSWGHGIEQIANKGLELLDVLTRSAKYNATLKVVQLIVPMFLPNINLLRTNGMFQETLCLLLRADKGTKSMMSLALRGTSDFPGPVLVRLGGVISYHLLHHHQYNLMYAADIATFWLQLLITLPNWIEDTGVIYLINILAKYAFTCIRTREGLKNILRIHYLPICPETPTRETVQKSPSGGTLSSLVKWINKTKIYPSSLLQTPLHQFNIWFAGLVIDLDQEAQQVMLPAICQALVKYHGQGNPSGIITQAIADCGATLQSHELAIYRWASLCIDVPLDHPLAVYFWEQFLAMFLCPVPSVDPRYCLNSVAERFLEGSDLLPLLKNKLECLKAHFGQLSMNQATTDEEGFKKSRAAACCRLYSAFLYWLEDPKLRSGHLNMEELPAAYDASNLSLMLNGEKVIWMKFVSRHEVCSALNCSAEEWLRVNFRLDRDDGGHAPLTKKTMTIAGLLEQMHFSEFPLPAPLLNAMILVPRTIVSEIAAFNHSLAAPATQGTSRQSPVGADTMQMKHYEACRTKIFLLLDQAIQSLASEAELYKCRLAKLAALDGDIGDSFKDLYLHVSRQHVKVATCSSSPQPSRASYFSNTPSASCAGGATLCLTVQEAIVKQSVQSVMDTNRVQYREDLLKMWEPLLDTTCSAIMDINSVVSNMCADHDDSINRVYSQVGVEIFFYMYAHYKGDLVDYPPANAAFVAIIVSTAKTFLLSNSYQSKRLLGMLIQEDRMVDQLVEFLLPQEAPSYMFVEMYTHLSQSILSSRPSSFIRLLETFKFDRWFERRPTLIERATLIKFLLQGLSNIGHLPTEDLLPTHLLYCKHLMIMMQHSFPEHFGEILSQMLECTRNGAVSRHLWYLLINSLVSGQVQLTEDMSIGQTAQELRVRATFQSRLNCSLLMQIARSLGEFFMEDRTRNGMEKGLYVPYIHYVDVLTTFLGLIGHCLVITSVEVERGTLSDPLCNTLCSTLTFMFTPWLVPVWSPLSPSRTTVETWDSPWTEEDAFRAHKVAYMFTEVIRLIVDMYPGCSNVLGFVWQWYMSQFTRSFVMEHVRNVIQEHLHKLPWFMWTPRLQDMDSMADLTCQFLPTAHVFVGKVFTSVLWVQWAEDITKTWDLESVRRGLGALLKLLVTLSTEPTVREKSPTNALIVNTLRFPWDVVDASPLSQALDYWVSRCDSRVILSLGETYTNPIDAHIFKLLSIVAGFDSVTGVATCSSLEKRVLFVRACAKMLTQSSSKYATTLYAQRSNYVAFICRTLGWIEASVDAADSQVVLDESCAMLSEMMYILMHMSDSICNLVAGAMVEWLSSQDSSSRTLTAYMKLGSTLTGPDWMGSILEAALTAYFSVPVEASEPVSWTEAADLFASQPAAVAIIPRMLELGHILTVHAIHYRSVMRSGPTNIHAKGIIELYSKVKANPKMDTKLPLLWGLALYLIVAQLPQDKNTAVRNLEALIDILQGIAEERGGILATLRLRKGSSVSVRCRLLSRAMAAFLLAQLPECGDQNVDQNGDRLVRTGPHSEGSVLQVCNTANVHSQYHTSLSAKRALNDLENLYNNKLYSHLKDVISTSATLIKDSNQSLLTAGRVLQTFTAQVYGTPLIFPEVYASHS